MAVVPIRPVEQQPQPRQIPEVYLMMAAAQMHDEGRLVKDEPEQYWPSNGDRKDGPSMVG